MRLSAPVVFRLRWVAGPRAGRRGGIHARYIATRSGVDLGEHRPDPLVHARYLGERPGSTGLFGPDPAAPPDLADVQEAIGGRPWHWQMVLSLREEDARALGVSSPADWRDLVRRILPQYAAAVGADERDLGWAAAMHRKAGHPHVDVLGWLRDRAPDRPPALARTELRAVRRIVTRETYGPVRAAVVAAKTAERDLLVAAGRVNLRALHRAEMEAQVERPSPSRLPPRFSRPDLESLGSQVRALRSHLPDGGRLTLAYMPTVVPSEARGIADWVLDRPDLAASLTAMDSAVRDLTALYQREPAAADAAWQRARDDVRDGIAQGVLRSAAGPEDAPARTGDDLPHGAARLLRLAHRTLEAERLRAEAQAELARSATARREMEHGAHAREAEMGASGRL